LLQAGIHNIAANTGKSPADLKHLAGQDGLLEPGVKTGKIIAWQKEELLLGRGHARATVVTLQSAGRLRFTFDEQMGKRFVGEKAGCRMSRQIVVKNRNIG
jgi:Domain of unknown function (DUF4287)